MTTSAKKSYKHTGNYGIVIFAVLFAVCKTIIMRNGGLVLVVERLRWRYSVVVLVIRNAGFMSNATCHWNVFDVCGFASEKQPKAAIETPHLVSYPLLLFQTPIRIDFTKGPHEFTIQSFYICFPICP